MKTQRFIETRDRECHRHRNYQSQDPFQLHPWVLEHNDNKKLPSIDCHPIEPPAVSIKPSTRDLVPPAYTILLCSTLVRLVSIDLFRG